MLGFVELAGGLERMTGCSTSVCRRVIAHLPPELVGELHAHALPQEIERFLFIKQNDGEGLSVDDGSQRAMIAVDHRRADPIRKSDDNAEALVRRDMIQMLLFDMRPAEPLLEVVGVGGDERMSCGHFPGAGDAEAHSPEFEVFFAGDVFGADDGTAGTVVVVCE